MEQKLRRNTTLGDNLRRLRKAAGLTQAMAVAQLQLLGFDISREILSQTENGRYNVPVSLHVFPFGPHGVGLGREDSPLAEDWPDLLADFLRTMGF